MNIIDVGTPVDLKDLLHGRLLIQGNSGSGKSGLARNIIEQSYGIIPFIMWDLEGEHYPLKEFNGDIMILGGQHADIPISMQLAPNLPKFILENQLNIVVDLSDFKMSQRIHFTKLFFEALMDLPIKYWTPYFFFLEECQKLCGEQDKQESAIAIKDLFSRGRKRGYCAIPITQRISMLNKSVASECNNKFIGKTVLDIDMDRSAKELGFRDADMRLHLRDLQPGHFFAYGSSIQPNYVHEVTVNMPQTKLVKYGAKFNYKPKKPTEKLKSMLAKLNELPAEKEKELKTTHDLQKEVASLKLQLKTATSNGVISEKDLNQITALKNKNAELQNTLKSNDILFRKKDKMVSYYKSQVDAVLKILQKEPPIDPIGNLHTPAPVKDILLKQAEKYSSKPSKNIPVVVNQYVADGEYKLKKCPLEILRFLASYPERDFTKVQVAIGCDYSPTSSGFDNGLSELNVRGLIKKHAGRISVVPVEDLYQWTGTYEQKKFDIHTFKDKLKKCESEIYTALINDPHRAFTKEEMADNTGYSATSSGFDNSISRLNVLELIRKEGKGITATIQLNPELLEL